MVGGQLRLEGPDWWPVPLFMPGLSSTPKHTEGVANNVPVTRSVKLIQADVSRYKSIVRLNKWLRESLRGLQEKRSKAAWENEKRC